MTTHLGRRANILLVDDDIGVRESLGEALAAENYQVTLAASSSEARGYLQQHGDKEVHAVLLDLTLGNESGWDFLLSLEMGKPNLPVIMITAARGQQIPPDARRRCVALMEKPLDLPRLFEALRNLTAPVAAALPPQSCSDPILVRNG